MKNQSEKIEKIVEIIVYIKNKDIKKINNQNLVQFLIFRELITVFTLFFPDLGAENLLYLGIV